MLKAGQKIFEYEIIRQLGKGGFASVYEAKDLILGRHVAIKQLSLERIEDKKNVKRFIQEARVAAALEHPNVVSIYALRGEGDNFYMIMEYLPGGTLKGLLKTQGKLPLPQALSLTIGICEGLARFHQQGIVHRDIKAENILLTADGRPKVIDFGIAHVPEDLGGLGLTQAGFQPSSLLYSSPEQMRGHPLDARSDIYQIGQLLYQMLTGEHIINLKALETQALTHGGTNQFRSQAKLYELLEMAVCEETPAGLTTLWREFGALAGLVERALAKDPDLRFRDAATFADALKTISANAGLGLQVSQPDLNNALTYNKRGLASVRTRNYEQAIIEYSRAIELDPRYVEVYHNRSTAYLLLRNYWQALIDSNWAIELAPNFVAAYISRGIAYTGLRDYLPAIEAYQTALKLDEQNIYAYYNLGNTYLWRGDFELAVQNYSHAIAQAPNFVAAYVNRGVAYNELNSYKHALSDFNKAIELNPDYEYAFYNRATLHRELDHPEEAIAGYGRVIQLNQEHPYAYKNRADIYLHLGEKDKAAADYNHIIAQTSSIDPERFSIARSMLMPTAPLGFLAV